MSIRIFTICWLVMLGNVAFGQWVTDSVAMGTASSNDVFYKMSSLGAVKTENNKNWHIAFSMSPSDSGSIWANHNTGNAFVKVYNIHKNYAQWNTVTLADTATAALCYNYDKGWYQGAFNDLPRPSLFSFGWGTYDIVSHNVSGDSMFIVKANNNFYKVYIHSLISLPMDWAISVEDMSTSVAYTDTISRGTKYANSNFAYYDLALGIDSNREPAKSSWDLVFNRYNTLASLGGPAIPYSVIGALANKGVSIVKVNPVHVDSAFANYANYIYPWPSTSNIISGVGYDWKTPPSGPGPWTIPDSVSYFIKSGSDPLVYQLQFTGYSGSGSGNIYFRKRTFDPTKVDDIHSDIQSFNFYPNPTHQEVHLMFESKVNTQALLSLTDITGKVILRKNIDLKNGINGYHLTVADYPNGHYLISLKGNNINISSKLQILK